MVRSKEDLRHLIGSVSKSKSMDNFTVDEQSMVDLLLAAAAEVCRSRSILKWAYVLRYHDTLRFRTFFFTI